MPDLHDPIRQSGSNLCVCGATVDDPVHATGVAPGVRTHSVRQVPCSHPGCFEEELRCRGCGERWDLGASIEVLQQEPCGTRSPDPGSEAETSE